MIAPFIRAKFTVASRPSTTRTIRRETSRSVELVQAFGAAKAERSVDVGKMIGIDPEMQKWSPYQTLEHNAIVNRNIERIVTDLANGREHVSDFDIKTDVLPEAAPGEASVATFAQSVESYLSAIDAFDQLRRTPTFLHPLFGPLNAHQWHGMFSFHLLIHRRQLERGLRLVKDS